VLRTDLATDIPPVVGDRVQLQQVILNLLINSLEAVSSVADRPRELLVRSRQYASDQVLIAMEDSAVGIDSQNLEKIFDAFYTTKSQGMGMGLAISRPIIENHGGGCGPYQMTVPARRFNLHWTLVLKSKDRWSTIRCAAGLSFRQSCVQLRGTSAFCSVWRRTTYESAAPTTLFTALEQLSPRSSPLDLRASTGVFSVAIPLSRIAPDHTGTSASNEHSQ
jgi:hypothetical protein